MGANLGKLNSTKLVVNDLARCTLLRVVNICQESWHSFFSKKSVPQFNSLRRIIVTTTELIRAFSAHIYGNCCYLTGAIHDLNRNSATIETEEMSRKTNWNTKVRGGRTIKCPHGCWLKLYKAIIDRARLI